MRDTTTTEHFAVIIWDGHHTDGGRIAVYPTMSSLMERLSVGDLLVEQVYGGLFLGRRCAVDFTAPTEHPESYAPGRRRRAAVVTLMDVPAAPDVAIVDEASWAETSDDIEKRYPRVTEEA